MASSARPSCIVRGDAHRYPPRSRLPGCCCYKRFAVHVVTGSGWQPFEHRGEGMPRISSPWQSTYCCANNDPPPRLSRYIICICILVTFLSCRRKRRNDRNRFSGGFHSAHDTQLMILLGSSYARKQHRGWLVVLTHISGGGEREGLLQQQPSVYIAPPPPDRHSKAATDTHQQLGAPAAAGAPPAR